MSVSVSAFDCVFLVVLVVCLLDFSSLFELIDLYNFRAIL